jgi:hypothetical protein
MKIIRTLIVCILIMCFFNYAYSQEPLIIKGKITNANNNPLSSVWVVVVENDSIIGKSLTGDDGKYFINKLATNRYKIYITRDLKLNSVLDSSTFRIAKDTILNFKSRNN